jgi:hypothetical protein
MAIQNNPSKTIVGGRSVVSITDNAGNTQVIGIFESCQISESLSTEDVHILGRYSADEIVVTAYNTVQVNCSGFRVYGYGVKALGKFPKLNDLLGLGPVTITVADRENPTGAPMATIIGCIPDNNSNSFNAKSTSRINLSYKGTLVTDESSQGDGESGATSLP